MTAKEIKQLRKDRGLTQQQLASELGVAISTVYLWEKGKTSPKGPALKLLTMLQEKAEKS